MNNHIDRQRILSILFFILIMMVDWFYIFSTGQESKIITRLVVAIPFLISLCLGLGLIGLYGMYFLKTWGFLAILGWMLSHTTGLSYWSRVIFVLAFALAAGIAIDIPYWNWFAFDARYTIVAMGDLIVGWFFGGLVLAKFGLKRPHHTGKS